MRDPCPCICPGCKCAITGDTADEFDGYCPECDQIRRDIEDEEADAENM
jgi:hypothetical protein